MSLTKILIVDDEKGFTDMLSLNLESIGRYEVRVVNEALNAVEEAIRKANSKTIRLEHLPEALQEIEQHEIRDSEIEQHEIRDSKFVSNSIIWKEGNHVYSFQEVEKKYIENVLNFTKGNRTQAAKLSNLSTSTLQRRTQKLRK